MDERIEKSISELLSAVKGSEVYLEYKKQEEKLGRNPELKERVNQFRANNFLLQNEADRDNLFHAAEQLAKESAQLRRDHQVNAYLDAELALCRLIQKIGRTMAQGVDMDVPKL